MAEDFSPGLEGVIAFETEIAEPDKDGGALRYRGVDIEDLAGAVTFGNVWALLVDGKFGPGLPPAEPFPIPVHTGDVRVDVQAALAMLGAEWGFGALIDTSDEEAREQLARASVMALSFVAQSARGIGRPPVPQRVVDQATSIPERFLGGDVEQRLVAPDRRQHGQCGLDVDPDVAGVHRDRERLRRRQPRPELPIDQQSPDVAERHVPGEVFDVDAAVAQRAAVLVRLGDLGLERDDALEAGAVVGCH